MSATTPAGQRPGLRERVGRSAQRPAAAAPDLGGHQAIDAVIERWQGGGYFAFVGTLGQLRNPVPSRRNRGAITPLLLA